MMLFLGIGHLQLRRNSKCFLLKPKLSILGRIMEKEELQKILNEINSKLRIMEEVRDELRRLRQAQENKAGLAPRFVESSPQIRTYGAMIENLIRPNRGMGYMPQREEFIYAMGYFDQVMLDKLIPIAKQVKIISPSKATQTKRNKDALERINKAGAEVRLHPMLHARIFCAPKRIFLIIGSGDVQTDCFGGSRFDAGVWSNNPELIKDAMKFFDRVWEESEPLDSTQS